MTKEPITIIGAGIGGLTTALALQQKGYSVIVYESAPEIKPLGAGLIMANNAMQIFRYLGIQHKIENAGQKVNALTIADSQHRTISRMCFKVFEEQHKVFNIGIHRGKLQQILAKEVGFENIKLSKQVLKIEKKETFKLTFEDNSTSNTSLIIGADGIQSTVRTQLFDQHKIRDAKQICWLGICKKKLSGTPCNEAMEFWGRGKKFGYIRIGEGKVYWFAVVKEKILPDKSAQPIDLFKKFHSDVRGLIEATPTSEIITTKMTDLKPSSKWHKDNVCLLGDAAHATTPNMGQGASQAIEDAYTLAQLFLPRYSTKEIFKMYEEYRMSKAHFIVENSWRIGKLTTIDNRLMVWLRNNFIRSIPQKYKIKQLEKVFDIGYL